MHPDLLELLACPECHGELLVRSRDKELACTKCGRLYPIVRGIPRFVESESTPGTSEIASQFFTEFTALAAGDGDMDPYALREYYFFTRTGIDPVIYEALPGDPYKTELPENHYLPDGTRLQGRLVLDAGCGPGRFTEVAANHGARLVVGLELGNHVDRAAQRCQHRENVAFVQGSLLNPPFRMDSFNLVFSIGVLHHTGNAELGAQRLAALVAPEGSIALWVYPPEYWGRGPQRPLARLLHKLISKRQPSVGLRICEKVLYPLGKLQMRVHRHKSLKLLMAPFFLIKVPRHPHKKVMLATIFDYYGPKYISTHSTTDVCTWLTKSGFIDVAGLPVPSSALGKRGV